MTYTFTADAPAQPVPGSFICHKFGRIETVLANGREIEIRQPNGCLLTAILDNRSVDAGTCGIHIGRNIWVSGSLDGSVMQAEKFTIYDEEI